MTVNICADSEVLQQVHIISVTPVLEGVYVLILFTPVILYRLISYKELNIVGRSN
jgi:hypothetical protein